MTRSHRIGLALLITVSAGAFAAPAHAASGGVASVISSTTVQYKAGKGKQNQVVVTRTGRTITIDDKVAIKAGKGCKKVKGDKTKVRCTTTKAPTRVRVYTYDRSDSIVNNSDLGMSASGGTGKDSITGGSGADSLYGGNGDDKLHGRSGDDWLVGGAGNDREYGGPGADTFYQSSDPSGPDADTFAGGSDEDGTRDVVAYTSRRKTIVADNDGATGDDGAKGERDSIGTDVENIEGGHGNDRLTGSGNRDVLYGRGGNDVLIGGGGPDYLVGGAGEDRLEGGTGDDGLVGDDPGSPFADVLLGGAGRDHVDYTGYPRAVTVDLDGAAGDDGQAGERDTVGADVEAMTGGNGDDRLTGNAADNSIYGGPGDDIIHGGDGNDRVEGSAGRDRLYGDAGDDELAGYDGLDGDTPDRLDGGANTAAGDACSSRPFDMAVNCELVLPPGY